MKHKKGKVASLLLAATMTLSGMSSVTALAAQDTTKPTVSDVTMELIDANEQGEATKESKIVIKFHAQDNVGVETIHVNLNVRNEENTANECIDASTWHASSPEDYVTVDGNNYTATYSLERCEYRGILYLSWLEVGDKMGNEASLYNPVKTTFKMNGTKDVVAKDPANSQSEYFNITSANVYDAGGNAFAPGAIVTPGTTVQYEVVTEDEFKNVRELYANVGVRLSDNHSYRSVTLAKVEGESKKYRGEFTFTEDMIGAAWFIGNVSFYDSEKNQSYNGYPLNRCDLVLKVDDSTVLPNPVNVSTYKICFDDANTFYQEYVGGKMIPMYEKISDYIELPTLDVPEGMDYEWHAFSYISTGNTSQNVDLGKVEDVIITNTSSYAVAPVFKNKALVSISYPEEYTDNGELSIFRQSENMILPLASENELIEAAKVAVSKKATDKLGGITYTKTNGSYGVLNIICKTEKIALDISGYYYKKSGTGYLYESVSLPLQICDRRAVPSAAELKTQLMAKMAEQDDNFCVKDLNFASYKEENVKTTDMQYFAHIRPIMSKEYCTVSVERTQYPESSIERYYEVAFPVDGELTEDAVKKAAIGYKISDTETIVGIENFHITNDNYAYANGLLTLDGDSQTTTPTDSTPVDSTPTSSAKNPIIGTRIEIPKTTEKEEVKVETTTSGKKQVVEPIIIGKDDVVAVDNGVALGATAKQEINQMITDAIAKNLELGKTEKTETPKVQVKTSATVIPTEILEQAKGKDVDVEFVMEGGYSWTFNGKDITADKLKDVNLKLEKVDQVVPKSVFADSKAKDMPNIQLTLPTHGWFGFPVKLKYYVGKEYAGQYANLLYYTEGRLQVENSHLVDEDGNTELIFEHASDYAIAMGANLIASPKTGDNAPVMPMAATMMLGFACIAIAACRRKVF